MQLDHLADLLADLTRQVQQQSAEIAGMRRELAMARRGVARPYYTADELQRLLGAKSRQSVYNWAYRKGIQSDGHNKYPRDLCDMALGRPAA